MTMQPKYQQLLLDDDVRRWFENLRAKSVLTATVALRNLGHYCELTETTPKEILIRARTNEKDFRYEFTDFVRKMEKEGKAGSYIARFKKVILSWLKFNDIRLQLTVNISGENETPTIANERVPSKEELARVLRKATSRGRVAIAIMAFSGLRPESLGDYEGSDGLRLGDFKELKLSNEIQFDNIPAMVMVKSRLSKTRHQYFSFIGEEGVTYIREYLEERRKQGEELTYESPLLQFDSRGTKKNAFLRTTLVTRDIREAIEQAGLKMRPYVLRAYFSTALDIAESKGLISHPWRQFIMGHKGDIEARYSTNKRLPPDIIDEMRESYRKCLKFLETRISEVSEDNAKLFLQQQLLSAVGYKQEEIDKIDLASVSNEDFQQLLRDKVAGAMSDNGAKQKVIPVSDIEQYISDGYDFEAVLPNGKAVMRVRF
ncbi:integrase [Candidatus Mancarchaeum acidiphilum]|uniref:Integrase n=1 Tax=Candidatus Mancarchaeum acidiphilum TaxID=1920749 RepID=A0A218NNW1_9ARCH|nr:site-specific integrase [Candidatus Mancarchaeum acidiphilum]ASI14170.1 integrase [Candidatus Mancarchaeum acidiphilum]